MTRKSIPVAKAAKEWLKNPQFKAAYDALEVEFARVQALINAHADIDMTDERTGGDSRRRR